MKIKFHFGIVIALLVFFGRIVDNTTAPNQQIILQFSSQDLNKEANKATLKSIQLRLKAAGVNDIKIIRGKKGQLKITYFSKADIAHIKSILSSDLGVSVQHSKKDSNDLPDSEALKHYEFSISEITKSNPSCNWDFETIEIVEINHKTDRYTNNQFDMSWIVFGANQTNKNITHYLKSYQIFLLTKSNSFYNIPEVRAGPFS